MLATPELMLQAAQPQRLAEVLSRTFTTVPLYRRRPAALGVSNGEVRAEELQRLPLITKQDIRHDFPHNFLPAGSDLEVLLEQEVVELEHTAGTSEERTPLLLPRNWWAEQELRALRLNPHANRVLEREPTARRVNISSPFCSGDICYTGVPTRNERIIGNTLFLSLSRFPFLWGRADLERMAAEALEWQPRFLDVDPVYGAVFARYCEQQGIRLPSVEFILCSYEFVSVCHRRILERVFQAPVLDLYGSTETGHLLVEDSQGWLRPSLETAFLEVINPDALGLGELVVTTLTNEFMPLVRYAIGDLVELVEQPYGNRYRLHGRAKDAFTVHGQRVTTRQVDTCFAETDGVLQYQLLQRCAGHWLLRYVTDGRGGTQLQPLQERLADVLGTCGSEVQLEQTELLLPEKSGKFRLGYPAQT